MTKKDFELIAKVISDLDEEYGFTDWRKFHLATVFSVALNRTNDSFNREKFIEACLANDE